MISHRRIIALLMICWNIMIAFRPLLRRLKLFIIEIYMTFNKGLHVLFVLAQSLLGSIIITSVCINDVLILGLIVYAV
jgi:hypothetical protein